MFGDLTYEYWYRLGDHGAPKVEEVVDVLNRLCIGGEIKIKIYDYSRPCPIFVQVSLPSIEALVTVVDELNLTNEWSKPPDDHYKLIFKPLEEHLDPRQALARMDKHWGTIYTAFSNGALATLTEDVALQLLESLRALASYFGASGRTDLSKTVERRFGVCKRDLIDLHPDLGGVNLVPCDHLSLDARIQGLLKAKKVMNPV